MVLSKAMDTKIENCLWSAEIIFLNKQDGRGGEARYALMKRNCVFYLIVISRKGNQARFELFCKISEAVIRRCSVKKVLLTVSENSQEKIPTQMFCCELSLFYTEHLQRLLLLVF